MQLRPAKRIKLIFFNARTVVYIKQQLKQAVILQVDGEDGIFDHNV